MNWGYNRELNYHYLLNDDFSDENLHSSDKHTLALFNFYGTITWSERGELVSYNTEKLVLSSPLLDIVIESIKTKGYSVCILEIIKNINNLDNVKNTISKFINNFNLNVPVVLITEDNIYLLSKILYDLYKPKYIFGKKSFYCADEIDYYDSNPWYRNSDTDTIISKSLGFNLYKPEDVLGSFVNSNFIFLINDLVITCGQEYSGYDIFYESIELDIEHQGLECKMKMMVSEKIYFILSHQLLENDKIIKIKKNTRYVIVGSNPSLKERLRIASYFEHEDKNKKINYGVAWFTRPPYQWVSSYRNYLKIFDSPITTKEKWFRFN